MNVDGEKKIRDSEILITSAHWKKIDKKSTQNKSFKMNRDSVKRSFYIIIDRFELSIHYYS